MLSAWSERRKRALTHPFLEVQTTYAMLPHLRARVLARHLRGDLDAYVPFVSQG